MKVIRLLSLDIVLGACVSTACIARYLEVSLSFSTYLMLGLCVWLIYTTDHLIDAQQVAFPASTLRHYFHQKHFKTLIFAFFIGIFACFMLLFMLDLRVILGGLGLTLFVLFYFLLQSFSKTSKQIPKEILAAFLYSSGIFLAPVFLAKNPSNLPLFILFTQFTFLALSNLYIFSYYEFDIDKQDGHVSLAIKRGKKVPKTLCLGLVLFLLISTVAFISLTPFSNAFTQMQWLFFSMAISLFAVLQCPGFFRQKERYRIFADAIFIYPLILVLFP